MPLSCPSLQVSASWFCLSMHCITKITRCFRREAQQQFVIYISCRTVVYIWFYNFLLNDDFTETRNGMLMISWYDNHGCVYDCHDSYVVIKEMKERLLSLLRRETVVFTARIIQCPDIEADKTKSLVLCTELLYGHLLCIYEGNIAPQLVTEKIVRCWLKQSEMLHMKYMLLACAFYWFIWKS